MKKQSYIILFLILIVITLVALFIFKNSNTTSFNSKTSSIEKEFPPNYTIKNTYNLPETLNEISGIDWLSNNTFACVQDEDGYIFIYDTQQNSIINKIAFAGAGDYEGIAINSSDAYVLRSDGLIYEILNYNSESRKISKIKTPFTEVNNIESLTFDKKHIRLLIAPKDEDIGKKQYKCIYQIPINTKEFDYLPLLKIDLKSNKLKEFKHKKIQNILRPSAIAIHPITNDIYILEGKDPKLLILNSNGELLKVYTLDKNIFAQPEGVTFSDNGSLFISNEANGNTANILEVQLK